MTWGAAVTLSVVERSFGFLNKLGATKKNLLIRHGSRFALCRATFPVNGRLFYRRTIHSVAYRRQLPLLRGSLWAVGFSQTAPGSKHSFSPLCANYSPQDCSFGYAAAFAPARSTASRRSALTTVHRTVVSATPPRSPQLEAQLLAALR